MPLLWKSGLEIDFRYKFIRFIYRFQVYNWWHLEWYGLWNSIKYIFELFTNWFLYLKKISYTFVFRHSIIKFQLFRSIGIDEFDIEGELLLCYCKSEVVLWSDYFLWAYVILIISFLLSTFPDSVCLHVSYQ